MPLLQWSDRLSVGVPVIDEDHKKLVQMINALYDLLAGERGPETLRETLDGLVCYIQLHFKREEDFFVRTGYPEAEAHQYEHAKMVYWVEETRERFRAGQYKNLPMDTLTYLRDWLFDHILGTDRKYIEHFREHGIANLPVTPLQAPDSPSSDKPCGAGSVPA